MGTKSKIEIINPVKIETKKVRQIPFSIKSFISNSLQIRYSLRYINLLLCSININDATYNMHLFENPN